MKKVTNFRTRKKNSNTTTPLEEKKEKLIITPETTISVEIEEQGRYSRAGFDDTLTKAERKIRRKASLEKMLHSLVIKEERIDKFVSVDGIHWRKLGKNEKVKNYYIAPNDYVEPQYHKCFKHINISAVAVNYFITNESCPYMVSKFVWDNLPIKAKIEVHLSLIAEGKPYSYQLLN